MDPKSFAGKSPPLETLDAAFASKLSSWVHRDMLRAKKTREEKQKKAAPKPDAPAQERPKE